VANARSRDRETIRREEKPVNGLEEQMKKLCLRRGLLIIAAVVSVFGIGPLPVGGAGKDGHGRDLKVTVSVFAFDWAGNPLTYRWRSTDGNITDQNAPSTEWTLPAGPGIHFAYVLVSNGKGGYTERRIAVNTDSLNSGNVLTGKDGCTVSTNWLAATVATGVRSRSVSSGIL
jgi:hypothetical protein